MPRRRRRDKRRTRPRFRDAEREFLMGPDLASLFAERDGSVFANDRERREIWGEHGKALCAAVAAQAPGDRPWAFWYFEGREELHNADRRAEALRFLARGGHLSDAEIKAIRKEGQAASARIDTEAERGTLLSSGWCPDTGDRRIKAAVDAMELGLASRSKKLLNRVAGEE